MIGSPILERFSDNPILKPELTHWWESKAVFNPSALYEGGKVHIIYRAIGDADISVFGYASSADGYHIDERLAEPVYMPREPFECSSLIPQSDYGRSVYISGGGGWGGCEDPRLTKIEDRVFMTYVAFDGYNPPRLALTSISLADFLSRNWQWRKSVLISPPGVVDKNACILPEKIGVKYVIFHRIFPDILIDFVDDLDFDGARWLKGEFRISPRSSFWDSRKIGAGPPPVKTKAGWLLIYHAVGNQNPCRYKMGAMLLDLEDPTRVVARSAEPILEPKAPYELEGGKPGMVYPYQETGRKIDAMTPDPEDPTKVIARSAEPILEPQAPYELEGWKPGVVYPCGAAVVQDRLLVYYGAADQVVCVASARLDTLIEQLVSVFPSEPAKQPEVIAPRKIGRVQGFCLKCRAKRKIKDARAITMKNGRLAIQGVCPVCSAKIFRTVSSYEYL